MFRISKFIAALSIFSFLLGAIPADAANWCRNTPDGTFTECLTPPPGYSRCPTELDGDGWCSPTGPSDEVAKHKKSKDNTLTNTLIYVGVGVAFVGIMWYIFKKPASDNNPGQVKLMSF